MAYNVDAQDLRELLALKSGALADVLEPDEGDITASVYAEVKTLVEKMQKLVVAFEPHVKPDPEPSEDE